MMKLFSPILHQMVWCVLWLLGTAEGYVVYGNGATSERTLPLCGGPREACNVIRKRFWLSPLVHRLCKCPDLTECPGDWGEDGRTIAFNPRAHLKFCSRIADLAACSDSVAAVIGTNGVISVSCFCGHSYRRMFNNATGQYFKCVPYGSCVRGDPCGRIAATSYETYHTCTCPPGDICVLRDRTTEYANEFLYQGQAYRGYCTPV